MVKKAASKAGGLGSLGDMKKRVDDTEQKAKDLLDQAEALTKIIPGTKDDQLVESIKKQVENVTGKYDKLKDTLSGVTGDNSKKG